MTNKEVIEYIKKLPQEEAVGFYTDLFKSIYDDRIVGDGFVYSFADWLGEGVQSLYRDIMINIKKSQQQRGNACLYPSQG